MDTKLRTGPARIGGAKLQADGANKTKKKKKPSAERDLIETRRKSKKNGGPETGVITQHERTGNSRRTLAATIAITESLVPDLETIAAKVLAKAKLPLAGVAELLAALDHVDGGAAAKILDGLKADHPGVVETLSLFKSRPSDGADPKAVAQREREALAHLAINTDVRVDIPGPSAAVLKRAAEYAVGLGFDTLSRKGDRIVGTSGGVEVELMRFDAKLGPAELFRAIGQALNNHRFGSERVVPPSRLTLEPKDGYDNDQAYWSAQLARLAYAEPPVVEAQLKAWGFGAVTWINDPATDTQGFVTSNDELSIVSFRGTSSFGDFKTDAKIAKTEAHGGGVHSGFERAHQGTWAQVSAALEKQGKPAIFTGHSLGAAIATLAASEWAAAGGTVEAVYLYGCPKVGNAEFAAAYNRVLGDKTFLHINHKDIVARSPAGIFGYVEVGREKRVFDGDGAIAIEPIAPPHAERMMMMLESVPSHDAMAAAERELELAEQAIAAMSGPDPHALRSFAADAADAPQLEGMMLRGPFQMFDDHKSEHYVSLTGHEALAAIFG